MEQIRAFHEASVVVNSLVEATKRLRDDKDYVLGEIELDWINSTIADADNAVRELSAFMAPFWANQYNNTRTSFSDHETWTRRDYQRALKKESRLISMHKRVETVFGHLQSLPEELNASGPGSKDGSLVTSLGSSELVSATRVISVVELPGQSPVTRDQAELHMPIPKIIVTHYDDVDRISCVHEGSPPPSYEATEIKSTDEFR
jgi:hypothetical protein